MNEHTAGREEIEKAEELLAAGDVSGLMRHLRTAADGMPTAVVAALVGAAAAQVGYDDLATAAASAADTPDEPQRLYDFGHACVGRGVDHLAIRPLSEALALAPDVVPILSELVAALEGAGRHAAAVSVLEEHETILRWPNRFQLVYNAIMAGELAKAETGFALLPVPDEDHWAPARDKVRWMLERAAVVRDLTPLDGKDLRGWHFVLTGGVLAGLAPWGFDQGMTGRWAYTSDSLDRCAEGLRRLGVVLRAAEVVPESVSLLPDRSSQILGTAAAEVFGLPAVPFEAGRPRTLIVAYDLADVADVDRATVGALRNRAPGQVLFEHATCWTDPPTVAADVSTLLGQMVVAPWTPQTRQQADGSMGSGPGDDRSAAEIAADIAAAFRRGPDDEPEDGDGATPDDGDPVVEAFVRAVAPGWLIGVRDHVASSGPVGSSRFL
jgi:hypothetical protein